jgi:hypothetical protein
MDGSKMLFHSPKFPPGKVPGTNWKGHWEGATAGMDVLQVSKASSAPAETEHVFIGSAVRSVVTIRTTLSTILI